jgi:hypothetical protein
MNICQISSLDLLLCLQNGNSEVVPLTQSPFFQQVLAIAQEDHLVCISDYAVQSFLQADLSPESQLQLERLLNAIDIWQTTPALQEEAQALSQTLKIALADAIDHVIYDHLCPDWILVAEEGRSLPNATSLAEFWREWIALRDDLPPDGGLSVGKYPPGGNGGGSPNDSGHGEKNKSSHSGKLTPDSSLIASNSVVFSHRNFVAWSMGLYNITNLPVTTVRPSSQAAEPTMPPTVKLASSNLADSPNLPVNVRVVIDPATQQPTIVVMTDDEVAALNLGNVPQMPIASLPVIQNLVERFGRSTAPAQNLQAQITQALQNVILRGGGQPDVLGAQAGNDLLMGGSGADFLDGGAGTDTASYRSAQSGVAVSLTTGKGTAGAAAGDQLQNIENLEGSDFDDTLVGDRQNNILAGRAGNDTIVGGGGNDILQGGGGNNVLVGDISFLGYDSPLSTMPATPVPPPPNGNPANAAEILNPPPPNSGVVISMSDWIFADAGDDVIDAGDGNNFVDAGAGNNQIESGDGQDLFVLNPGNGVTTILHFQQHDRLGLVGGVAYEDLSITAMPTQNQTPRVKITLNRNGVADVLAIVVGVSSLDRQSFRSVQYQPPTSSTLPTIPSNGMAQNIPDWLQSGQQLGQVLQVPMMIYQPFAS